MIDAARAMQSDYMRFAKVETAAPYNLASSGVADCALADLDVSLADLELHGPNAYGYALACGHRPPIRRWPATPWRAPR